MAIVSRLRSLAMKSGERALRFTHRRLGALLGEGAAAPTVERTAEPARPTPEPPVSTKPFIEVESAIVRNRELCAADSSFAASYRSGRDTIQTLAAEGAIDGDDVVGKRVLDWECGKGAFSARFLELGAKSVTAIDSWLDVAQVKATLGTHAGVTFERISVEKFADDPSHHGQFDFIFANTVTEHLASLAQVLIRVNQLLAPGGVLVVNHDNYYQPAGSHDHGFLFYDDKSGISFQGARCWETEKKCETSAEHRRTLKANLPWTWDDQIETALDPKDCSKCPYFKRAQPWAHLLHQGEFRTVFPQSGFTTGYKNSSLNKITLFQLRQFLIEAGFNLERWCPHKVVNQPPPVLLQPPFGFSIEDLTTSTVAVRCVKDSSPYR